MQSLSTWMPQKCPHSDFGQSKGLAMITIGDSFRGDDGVAYALCKLLPKSTLQDVCQFHLGTHTEHLATCLQNHKGAIIVDSTSNGTAPGTVTILDLGAVVALATPLNIQSCHGLLLADELRIAKKLATLPERLIFFGIEVDRVERDARLSSAVREKLPRLERNLSLLIASVLETLKQDA